MINQQRRHFASGEAIGRVESVQTATVGKDATPVVRVQIDLGGGKSVMVSFWGAAGGPVQHVSPRTVIRAWGRLAQWGRTARVSIDVRADSFSGYSLLTDAVPAHCGWTIRGRLEGVATEASRPNEAVAAVAVIVPAATKGDRVYPERRTEYTIGLPGHIAAALQALRPGNDVTLRGTIEDQAGTDGYGRVARSSRLMAVEIISPAISGAAVQVSTRAAEQLQPATAIPTGNGEVVASSKQQQRPAALPF
jgi:hypothetical protein